MDETVAALSNRIAALEARLNKPTFSAIFVSAEGVDADLSIIRTGEPSEILGTDQVRFVPKLASASPAAGDTVLCLRDPVIILGVQKGDINLASI